MVGKKIIGEAADLMEQALYPPGERNGRRARRMAIIATVLTAYVLYSQFQTAQVVHAVGEVKLEIQDLAAVVDSAQVLTRTNAQWIWLRQQNLQYQTAAVNARLRTIYRRLGIIEDFDPVQ